MKVGDKVKLTKSWAEWQLEHPECWYSPITKEVADEDKFEKTMKLAMLVLLESPPVGKIAEFTYSDTARVDFGRFGSEFCEMGADIIAENYVEMDVDLTPKSLQFVKKVAKQANVTPEQAISIMLVLGVNNLK